MIRPIATNFERVVLVDHATGVAEKLSARSSEEEQRLSIDKLQLWPPLREKTADEPIVATKDEEKKPTNRQRALDSMQNALLELDQLIMISKLLKQKETINLEVCGRQLKSVVDPKETVKVFVHELKKNLGT